MSEEGIRQPAALARFKSDVGAAPHLKFQIYFGKL